MAGSTYRDIVAGTALDKLELHARVIELRIGYGLMLKDIQAETGINKKQLIRIIKKYKPKETGRSLVITIDSII